MSEFKFACPVCGQHITADSSNAGGQIDCPTCFRKIVVPQAPSSPDTKLILSASQVAKPRPTGAEAASRLGPLDTSSRRSSVPATIALLVLLCGAGAALYVFRDRIVKIFHAAVPAATNAHPAQPAAPVALNTKYPIPTNILWTLDLTNAVIPEEPAVGKIHGSGFRCERAILRGGLLSLSQGDKWPWDLSVAVNLYVREGKQLSGQTVEVPADRARAPHVVLRWKDAEQHPSTEVFPRGYALKLIFGEATNAHIAGKIYIALPDQDKSFVAGTFDAQIRKPPPPKPPRRRS